MASTAVNRAVERAVADLESLAARQAGVFAARQARAAGLSPKAARRRVASGRWVAYRGVFRRADHPDTDLARAWSALLRGGTGTVLTGTSALMVLTGAVRAPVPTVCVPPDRHVSVPGAVVLRELTEPPTALLGGMFGVAGRSRAVIDALRTLPVVEAIDLADRLAGDGIDVDLLAATWLARHPQSRGNRQLHRIRDQVGERARSRAERVMHRTLRSAGIRGWVANLAVHDADGLIGLVDIGFERERVAIEIDGRAYHSDADRFQHDRTRQNRLVRAGWTVLRFTWDDLTARPGFVVATVRAVLARARRTPA